VANKNRKLKPLKRTEDSHPLVMRMVDISAPSRAVIATENPVERYDENTKQVVREVLLMDGAEFRGGRNQIPIVDSHDDRTVRNILGSIQGIQVDQSMGEMYGAPVFASDDDAQTIRQRMDEGHITDFSITAEPIESVFIPVGRSFTTARGEVIEGPAIIHKRWQPHNASICATGADVYSTVRRSYTDLKRKVLRMDEALLSQLAGMGLPEGMSDPNQVLAWVVGKLSEEVEPESEMVENMEMPPAEEEKPMVENMDGEQEKPIVENQVARSKEDAVKLIKRALAEDQKRRNEIQAAVKIAKLDRSFADELCDAGISVADANARIIKRMANQEIGASVGSEVRVTESSDDKFEAAMRDGIVSRSFVSAKIGKFDEAKAAPGYQDFKNMELYRMAETVLRRAQAPTDRMSRNEIAQAAMGNERIMRKYNIRRDTYHTTGSFPNLLLDAANKTLLAGYEEAPYTWNMWARQGPSVSDFKNINRMRFSEAPDPEMVPEAAPYKEKAMSDSKESYKVEKYGALFTISWETIVNDDLDAISRTPAMHGNACRRKVNKVVYSVLTDNPTMGDGVALFGAHTSGTNNSGASAAPSVTTLNAAFLAMATQKGLSSDAIIGVTPRFLIVPWALSATADQLVSSMADPLVGGSAAGNSNTHNIYGPNGKRKLTVIEEPNLDLSSASVWYASADPSQIDTVEVSFLQGEESPVLENDWDMKTDTYIYKVRQTFGVKAIDWRGLYRYAV
jgi:hypothetical protein